MATGFGRKGMIDEDMTARRAAFIASERTRAARQPEESASPASRRGGRGGGKAPVYRDEKTLFAAYLNWFLLGCVGAHRFYLGHMLSGAVQAMLGVGALLLLFVAMANQSLGIAGLSIFMLGTCGLWLLGDLILMPSMCERANAKLRRKETGRVFT